MAKIERKCDNCEADIPSGEGGRPFQRCVKCGVNWLATEKEFWCPGPPDQGTELIQHWNDKAVLNRDGEKARHENWVNIKLIAVDRDGTRWLRLKPSGWDGRALWFATAWIGSVPENFNKPCKCSTSTCNMTTCGHFHREMLSRGYVYNKWLPKGHRYVKPK